MFSIAETTPILARLLVIKLNLVPIDTLVDYLIAATSRYRKQSTVWSLTSPTACKKATRHKSPDHFQWGDITGLILPHDYFCSAAKAISLGSLIKPVVCINGSAITRPTTKNLRLLRSFLIPSENGRSVERHSTTSIQPRWLTITTRLRSKVYYYLHYGQAVKPLILP